MATGRCHVNPGSIACCTACETSSRMVNLKLNLKLKKCTGIEVIFMASFIWHIMYIQKMEAKFYNEFKNKI